MASLTVVLPEDGNLIPITPRLTNDLPDHVKGTAQWIQQSRSRPPCYTVTNPDTNLRSGVEFINNEWYYLQVFQGRLCTRNALLVARDNNLGLGYWNLTDPQHPDYQPISRSASRASFRFTPGSYASDSSSSGTASAHTPESVHNPNSPAVTVPAISLDAATLALGFDPQNTNPDVDMSVNTTTVATVGNPPNGLKGIAPAIFNGNRDRADNFLNEFRRYRLLNRGNDSISIPFYRVLTALSYIRGPIVEDWVNAQDDGLKNESIQEKQVTSSKLTKPCGENSKPASRPRGKTLPNLKMPMSSC